MSDLKKAVKKAFALVLSVAMVLALLPAVQAQAAAKPKLSKKSATVVVGGTATIKLKNKPSKATVTYKSKKSSVATVTSKGKVTGIKAGTAKIAVTVKKNSKKVASLTFTLKVSSPSLSKSSLKVAAGSSKTLKVKNLPKKNSVKWSSSDTSVAKVSSGKVTGVKAGEATITAKVTQKKSGKVAKKTYKLTCDVTVTGGSDTPDPGTDTPDPGTDTPDPGTDTPVVESTEKTAATQAEIDAALASSKLTKLTINTTDNTTITLSGDHKTVDLVVNAPNATIDNSATWKSVEIQAIKDNTWIERAIDNIFKILAPKARLVAAAGAKIANITVATTGSKTAGNAVKIEAETGAEIAKVAVDTSAANVEVKADGTGKVAEVEVAAANADVSISGTSTAGTKVTVDASAAGADITASSKVEITTAATNVDVKLESGAAGSTVASTDASAQVKVENATGSNVTVTDSTGKNTTVATGQTSTTTSSGTTTTGSTSSSSGSSGSSGVTPATSYTYTMNVNNVSISSGTAYASVSGTPISLAKSGSSVYVLTISGSSYTVVTGATINATTITYTKSGSNPIPVPRTQITSTDLDKLLTGYKGNFDYGTYTFTTSSQIGGLAAGEINTKANLETFLKGLGAIQQ